MRLVILAGAMLGFATPSMATDVWISCKNTNSKSHSEAVYVVRDDVKLFRYDEANFRLGPLVSSDRTVVKVDGKSAFYGSNSATSSSSLFIDRVHGTGWFAWSDKVASGKTERVCLPTRPRTLKATR